MANDFYESTGYPQTGAAGSSAAMRSELNSVEGGFNKLPPLVGNGNKLVKIDASGTFLESSSVISDNGTNANVTGDLVIAGGNVGVDEDSMHAIPNVAADTITLNSATQTLVNKTINAANNKINTEASGNLSSTELNAALAELQADTDSRALSSDLAISNSNITAHINDAAGAHAASAISSIPSGNLAAVNVQAALNELQSDINTREKSIAASAQKITTVDADAIGIVDSEASGALKRITWGSVKDVLRSYFDTIYPANDTAYGSSWNGDLDAPTKNSIYGKIETIAAPIEYGIFYKIDTKTPAFVKISAGNISIKSGSRIEVSGITLSFSVQTAITMPTLTAGTDYAIYVCTDGTIRADASFTFPTGYTALNSRKIGGFHYAPGGNATARAGGDTTPAINEYSIWDLKFKPASPDPRGQMLVSGGLWGDIYPLGVDHIVNGTSKFNVTIADGSSPPKVPTQFGGNGTTTYTTLTQFEAAEVMAAYGKRLPTYAEFAALAFGTTEATSGGTDPVSTILRAAFTSKWGTMLATGNMWFWGAEFGGGNAGAAWSANTTGRGSTYQMENAAMFGGSWVVTSDSGSRASAWNSSPSNSLNSIGARGVCDHVVLE